MGRGRSHSASHTVHVDASGADDDDASFERVDTDALVSAEDECDIKNGEAKQK